MTLQSTENRRNNQSISSKGGYQEISSNNQQNEEINVLNSKIMLKKTGSGNKHRQNSQRISNMEQERKTKEYSRSVLKSQRKNGRPQT